jgi:hypothetical protein
MHSKQSRKGKRHFRRRSIRHRRRTHNRKGGGKAELEAELAQLEASWNPHSGTPQHEQSYGEYESKRRNLLHKIAIASLKEEEGMHSAVTAANRAEEAYQTSLNDGERFRQQQLAYEEAARQRQAQEDARAAAWSHQFGPQAGRVQASHVPLATSIHMFGQQQLAYEAAARQQQAQDDARLAAWSRQLGPRQ